jgi:hypothetical protein
MGQRRRLHGLPARREDAVCHDQQEPDHGDAQSEPMREELHAPTSCVIALTGPVCSVSVAIARRRKRSASASADRRVSAQGPRGIGNK